MDMGKVSLLIKLSGILLLAHNICCGYDTDKGYNEYSASLGDEVDRFISTHMDPLIYLAINRSHPTQQCNVKDATQSDGGSIISYYAEHRMATQTYYGVEATSDIYGFPIEQGSRSGIFVQIGHFREGPRSIQNGINVGWHINPELYGDSKTHFYVYWTRDGYQKTGCYNLQCPGYVPEPNIPTLPGIVINSVSNPDGVKHMITIKIFKDHVGDWLLHVGFDSEPYLVGRFPKSLFTGLNEKADIVRLAGFVMAPTTNLAPMGSGFLPDNPKAASFSNIQLIDQKGVASKVQHDQPIVIIDKKVYSVSPISAEGKFTYSGPRE